MMEVCVSVQLEFYFSSKSAVKPMPRCLGTGGQESNIQSLSYQWDPAGNLTSRQDLRQGLLESFGYDALDRLTTGSGLGGVTSIGYDAIGNIMSKTGIAGTFTYDSTRRHALKSAGHELRL